MSVTCTLVAFGLSDVAEDESEFNYNARSERGPAWWGEIRREWKMCRNGSMQSPIDLLSDRVQVVAHLGRLKRSYEASNATLKNRGHDIMVGLDSLSLCLISVMTLIKEQERLQCLF